MTLPTFQGSIDRIFPFAPKTGSKKGGFKISIYNTMFEEKIEFKQPIALFFKAQMFRDAKAGFQHTIPLSTNFKLFKHLSMSTSANFKRKLDF